MFVDKIDNVPTIRQEDLFRPGEDVFIQLSPHTTDFDGMMHKHTFIELAYIVSGSGTHTVGDRSSKFSKGDLFIINYDTPHSFRRDENGEELVMYDLLFTPRFFDVSLINAFDFESINSSFLFYSLFPSERIGPDIHISGSKYNIFSDIFKKIHTEFEAQKIGYINIIRAYVVELIIQIFRRMSSAQKNDTTSRQTQIVNSTLEYLRKNYYKDLSLGELAAQAFLSKDYFSRIFREITGMPINSLLQKIRIDEACKLLLSSNRTISDIAEQCGFHDLKYFYNVFKKTIGATPKQYRIDNSISIENTED